MLLDLKDGFYQLKLEKDLTKYFAFATPDGQFEYTRLLFGYSEAPAEFQKRIIQVLNSLIREDKIIIYMDDILIPSETVEQNLSVLEEVILALRKHRLELNFEKCKFLRKSIKFLGYVISAGGITLSPRHTQAIRAYR